MTHQWDELSKSLADESLPRRETLRRLGAVLAGTVLGPFGVQSAWAAPKARVKTDPCKDFCRCSVKKFQNQCLSACRNCSDPSRLCGSCVGDYACCGDGSACCTDSHGDPYCADLATDVRHCGACDRNCWDGARAFEDATCFDGECIYACAEGAANCGDGICTPLGWDPDNCGECGNVCPDSAPYCNDGTCVSIQCRAGLTLCYGACRDLQNESTFCGSSCETAVVCGQFEYCAGGECQPV